MQRVLSSGVWTGVAQLPVEGRSEDLFKSRCIPESFNFVPGTLVYNRLVPGFGWDSCLVGAVPRSGALGGLVFPHFADERRHGCVLDL
jgi:hypothetical protein